MKSPRNKLCHTAFKHPQHRSQGPKSSGYAGTVRPIGKSSLAEKPKTVPVARTEKGALNNLGDALKKAGICLPT
jgi:hypothetical protein